MGCAAATFDVPQQHVAEPTATRAVTLIGYAVAARAVPSATQAIPLQLRGSDVSDFFPRFCRIFSSKKSGISRGKCGTSRKKSGKRSGLFPKKTAPRRHSSIFLRTVYVGTRTSPRPPRLGPQGPLRPSPVRHLRPIFSLSTVFSSKLRAAPLLPPATRATHAAPEHRSLAHPAPLQHVLRFCFLPVRAAPPNI